MESVEWTLHQASLRVTSLKNRLFAAVHRCGCAPLCISCEDDLRFLSQESGQDPDELIRPLKEKKSFETTKR
jgi:hypothetical protein